MFVLLGLLAGAARPERASAAPVDAAAAWMPPFRPVPVAVAENVQGLLKNSLGRNFLQKGAPSLAACAARLSAESELDRRFLGAMEEHWAPGFAKWIGIAAKSKNETLVSKVLGRLARSYDAAVPEVIGTVVLEGKKSSLLQALEEGRIDAAEAERALMRARPALRFGPAATAAYLRVYEGIEAYRLAHGLASQADVFTADDTHVPAADHRPNRAGYRLARSRSSAREPDLFKYRSPVERRIDDILAGSPVSARIEMSLGISAATSRASAQWARSGVLGILRMIRNAADFEKRLRLADALARAALESPFESAQLLAIRGLKAEVERDVLPDGRVNERSAPLILAVRTFAWESRFRRVRDEGRYDEGRDWASRQLPKMSPPDHNMRVGVPAYLEESVDKKAKDGDVDAFLAGLPYSF